MVSTTPFVDPVMYRAGHLQIIACAGAGKTETIALRVAELLAEGVKPEGIIAFTFTDKAGAELKSRIETKVRDDDRLGSTFLDLLGPMFVGTMHGYCMRVLQQHVPPMAAFDVMDPHKMMGLLSREQRRLAIDQCFGGWGADNLDVYRRSIDVMENELIAPADLPDGGFRTSYGDFLQTLQNYRALTYGQMVVSAVDALQHDEDIRAAVLGPLKHVIVDEYQDTNRAQEQLVMELAAEGAHVCVVGDDDQAIYQWRGATVENILEFRARFANGGEVAVAELPANHRSQPPIVSVAQDFIESNVSERLKKSMTPYRQNQGGLVCTWTAEIAADEAEIIAQTMLRLHNEEGWAWGDMAVLLRSVKTSAKPIVEALEVHGIPVKSSGASGLFIDQDAQVLAKLYSWLADKPWKASRWTQNEHDYVCIDLDALVDEFLQQFELPSTVRAKLKRHLEAWKAHAADDKIEANLVRDYYDLLRLLGVATWDITAGTRRAARMGTLARYSTMLVDYEHATKRARPVGGEMQGGTQGGTWLYLRLYNYMQYYAQTSYEGFAGEETLLYDAVDVTTVHSAKGLQWPIVFIPCMTQRRFPSSNTGRGRGYLVPDDLFQKPRYLGGTVDEARLFYVGMTRARDAVYVSRFRRINNRESASQFFKCVEEHVEPIEAPLPLVKKPMDYRQRDTDLPIVTFSQLAAYDACPHAYRLRSLIGFEPPLARELGYGKAVHHVLRRIADETQITGTVPSTEEIETLVAEEFFLPFANKPAYRQMLQRARQLISTFVAEHASDFERVWETERPFELHLDSAIVSGRADVILDREDGEQGAMAIVDYKTAMDDDHTVHHRQLQVYTSAGLREGIDVRAAYLMDLQAGKPQDVGVGAADLRAAEEWAAGTVSRLAGCEFSPAPSNRCEHCDVGRVCPHGD